MRVRIFIRTFVQLLNKNYMIFFRYIGDTVEIVNVIEGHRDIKALFRKSE